VEPFAGSAAISLASAYKGLADRFFINDAHQPIIDLWREIIERPGELADKYRELWRAQLGREREYYDTVREKFNRTQKPEFFLSLLARCVKPATSKLTIGCLMRLAARARLATCLKTSN